MSQKGALLSQALDGTCFDRAMVLSIRMNLWAGFCHAPQKEVRPYQTLVVQVTHSGMWFILERAGSIKGNRAWLKPLPIHTLVLAQEIPKKGGQRLCPKLSRSFLSVVEEYKYRGRCCVHGACGMWQHVACFQIAVGTCVITEHLLEPTAVTVLMSESPGTAVLWVHCVSWQSLSYCVETLLRTPIWAGHDFSPSHSFNTTTMC